MNELGTKKHSNIDVVNPLRRRFIAKTAAMGLITIAPGVVLYRSVHAKSPAEAISADIRWGMLIDTNQLTEEDIDAAVDACHNTHGINNHNRPTTDAQWIRKVRVRDLSTQHVTTLPIMCQHCEKPPCVDVCPTGASFKRADGIVLVDRHICIGCRYCMMACPNKARSFVHEKTTGQLPSTPRGKGTVEACTMCVDQIDKDGSDAKLACAEAVNKGKTAIYFGDLNNPKSEVSIALTQFGGTQIRDDLGLNPGIRYWGL